MDLTALVLDFKKEEETKNCLISLRKNLPASIKIYLLDNGMSGYSQEYLKAGLCDVLIQNAQNNGCGNAIEQLFQACPTKYGLLVQNDQTLAYSLNEDNIRMLLTFFNDKIKCVDLAGGQAGQNKYSERAHIIERDFYLSIPRGEKGRLGGPGPFNHNKYTEQFVQEYFQSNNFEIAHVQPILFADNGKWSIREIGDGIYKHRCDTKQLYVIKKPTFKTEVYPPFNDEEWSDVFNDLWPNGAIPKAWQNDSFVVWEN